MREVNRSFSGIITLFFFTCFFIIFLPSCEKPPSGIGIDLQLSNSRLRAGFTDTISVKAFTVTLDSVRSDKSVYSPSGTLVDPVFGTTFASVVAQFRLSAPLNTGDNVHVDSLVLFLIPAGHYGDENTEMKVRVYESFKKLYLDSIYYSNMDITDSIGINPVGEKNVQATDSAVKIYLDPLLGEKLLSDSVALQSQAGFLEHFKGLYLAPPEIVSGNGAIIRYDLLSFDSKLTVYYGNSVEDSLSYDFVLNSSCARVNLFKHDFTTADPGQKINHLDDGIQDTVIYVQGNSGVMSRIDVPYLNAWGDSLPMAVNKVELILKVSPDDSINQKTYPLPDQLNLLVKNPEGAFQFVADNNYGNDYFGGILQDNEYHFNLSSQVQYYLSLDESARLNNNYLTQFYLIVNNGSYLSNRAVLTSALNTLNMQLRFTYTKIKN